ncbi:acyl-coenzyme A diphosphatase FITM2 [Lagopus leucura]|uniref:acyl-coenzyme A diphosphatase FITM2 n=1 Tax=Lagopus leucura TaxID=30410 RepID=UPI001C6772F5|nr:acyl-coenzyme A diphosphatase FITM2 [Lagopus leucura]
MERLERCARCLRARLVTAAVRRRLPWLLLGLVFLGSALKDADLVLETPMQNKRNALNVYFVKVAWAWTFWLLLPFIGVTTYLFAKSKFLYGSTKSILAALRRLSTLLVGTAVWYVCTELFVYIENLTGTCITSTKLSEPHQLYATKQECHRNNGVWDGFDISGHCFLLSYCTLMIVEEMAVLEGLSIDRNSRLRVVINGLFVSLCFLTMIWVFMFLCTTVYFHNFSQKLLGALIGLAAWYATYRVWYLKPFSPGLPLPNVPLSSKKYGYSR